MFWATGKVRAAVSEWLATRRLGEASAGDAAGGRKSVALRDVEILRGATGKLVLPVGPEQEAGCTEEGRYGDGRPSCGGKPRDRTARPRASRI